MEDFVDWSKPIQTEKGCPARLICCDREGDNPYVVLYKSPHTNKEDIFSCMKNGCSYTSATRIVNVPPPITKVKVYFLVSKDGYVVGVRGTPPSPMEDGKYRTVIKFVDVEVG